MYPEEVSEGFASFAKNFARSAARGINKFANTSRHQRSAAVRHPRKPLMAKGSFGRVRQSFKPPNRPTPPAQTPHHRQSRSQPHASHTSQNPGTASNKIVPATTPASGGGQRSSLQTINMKKSGDSWVREELIEAIVDKMRERVIY